MNHIYRTVWNEVTRTFVAVSELVKSGGKRCSKTRHAKGKSGAVSIGSFDPLEAPGLPVKFNCKQGILVGSASPMMLEQRFMFDGAAATEVVEVVAPMPDAAAPAVPSFAEQIAAAEVPPVTDTEKANTNNSDDSAEKPIEGRSSQSSILVAVDDHALDADSSQKWRQIEQDIAALISSLPDRADFNALMTEVFARAGTDSGVFQGNLSAFTESLRDGSFNVALEFRSERELQGHPAAYAAVTPGGGERIYVNADWLSFANSSKVMGVLIEEIGHAIDHRLNDSGDSVGDEGEFLATRLLSTVNENVDRINTGVDKGVLNFEGQDVAVEFAANTISFANRSLIKTADAIFYYGVVVDADAGAATGGADLLVAMYGGAGATSNLIGWQIINNGITTRSYSGNFNFAATGVNASEYTSFSIRVWQGTAGSNYSSELTYGNSTTLVGADTTGFRVNNNVAPQGSGNAAAKGAITFTGTPTAGGVFSNVEIAIDTLATVALTAATIPNTSNVLVQSTETGTAYLVNSSVPVTTLANITGATDNLWNSVAILSANTNTTLAAAGLAGGTYKVYTVDAAGNLSAAPSVSVTIGSGISPTVGDSLSRLAISQGNSTAKVGDYNGDGIQDAQQSGLATVAWTSASFFNQGLSGALTDAKPIISISNRSGSSGAGVSTTAQLLNIVVASYTDIDPNTTVVYEDPVNQTGTRTLTLTDGQKVTTPWDPIRFALEDSSGVLQDILPRAGTQVRMYIDIRPADLDVGTVNGYIKYVSAAVIVANPGLVDLDGRAITQAGWYDFTQRETGGDGARYVIENGKIVGIELIITDNAFGDNDMTANKILDPGVLVQRPVAQAVAAALDLPPPQHLLDLEVEKPAAAMSDDDLRHKPLRFDSSLFPVLASRTVEDVGLTEPVFAHEPQRFESHDWMRYFDLYARQDAWQVAVIPADVAGLQVFRGIGDQFAVIDQLESFTVPWDAFVHTSPAARVTLSVMLADGRPLPYWMTLNAKTGTFEFQAPPSFKGDLNIRVMARDAQGHEASTQFRMRIVEGKATRVADVGGLPGRSSLSDQLRQASQQRQVTMAAGQGERVVPVKAAAPLM